MDFLEYQNYIAHSKGPWKKHKYLKKIGKRYIYPIKNEIKQVTDPFDSQLGGHNTKKYNAFQKFIGMDKRDAYVDAGRNMLNSSRKYSNLMRQSAAFASKPYEIQGYTARTYNAHAQEARRDTQRDAQIYAKAGQEYAKTILGRLDKLTKNTKVKSAMDTQKHEKRVQATGARLKAKKTTKRNADLLSKSR